jgi:hypothetical protein
MAQQSEKPQQMLDTIRDQHKALLKQVEGPGEVDFEQVRKLLKTLAQAGTTIKDAKDRSLLDELIRYWSSFINAKTGEFPIVQLQPFEGRKISRRRALTGFSLAGVALLAGGSGIVYLVAVRNKPPASSPTPTPTSSPPTTTPTASPGAIFVGDKLATGYDLEVNTSGGLTNWVTVKSGEICMAYPSGQSWGAVFITVGKPTQPPRLGKDLSNYHQLSLELRGQAGGESVSIGIKDKNQPDDGSETKVPVSGLTTDWKTFTFPLSKFTGAHLHNLYVVIEFVFAGKPATVCARNIQYLL